MKEIPAVVTMRMSDGSRARVAVRVGKLGPAKKHKRKRTKKRRVRQLRRGEFM